MTVKSREFELEKIPGVFRLELEGEGRDRNIMNSYLDGNVQTDSISLIFGYIERLDGCPDQVTLLAYNNYTDESVSCSISIEEAMKLKILLNQIKLNDE